MYINKLLAFSFVAGLLFQTVAAAPVDNKTELEQNALRLLFSVAHETRQFNLPENRIHAQTLVMDLMWEHDEREAREIARTTFGELQNLFAKIAAADVDSMTVTEKNEHYYKRQKLAELRQEYILAMARRDPQAAITALAALKTKKLEGYDPLQADKLELQIASAMSRKDSDQTYAFVKKQIADKGITYETIDSLKEIHKSDSAVAARIAKDIFADMKTAAILVPPAAGKTPVTKPAMVGQPKIELGLVGSFINTASELNRLAARDKRKKLLPVLSDVEMRELVELVARSFLSERTPAMYSISQVIPEIARFAPAMVPRIRAKVGPDIARSLDMVVENHVTYRALEAKTPDELAQEADRAAPDKRDRLYTDAMAKALEANDPEMAQTIGARVKDRKGYGYLFEQIEAALPLAKARRGETGEVRKLLAGLKTDRDRIAALTELSLSLAAKGDKETAQKLLDESVQLMLAAPPDRKGLESMGQITTAYSVVDPEKAFTMVEIAVEQMNPYIDAGIRLDEFYDLGSLEAGELRYASMARQLLLHIPNSSDLLKNLARADFDRAVRLTDRFGRPEIRRFGRLRIAQVLLDREAAEKEKTAREQIRSQDDYH